jgi:hypothetical protein
MQQVRSYFADLEPERMVQFCVRLEFLALPYATAIFTRELLVSSEVQLRCIDDVFFAVKERPLLDLFEIQQWVLLVHEDDQARSPTCM